MSVTDARLRRDTTYILDVLRELERRPNISRHELADNLSTGEARLNKYLERLINYPVRLVTESASGLRCMEVKGPVVKKIALQIVREQYAAKAETRARRREKAHSLPLRTRAGRLAYSDFRRYFSLTRDKKIQHIKAVRTRKVAKLWKNDAKVPEVWVHKRTRELTYKGQQEIEVAKKKCREQKYWAKARIADVESFERLFSLVLATAGDKHARRARRRLLRECVDLWGRIEESRILRRWTEVRRYLEAKEARRRYFAFKRAEFQKHARIITGLLKSSKERSSIASGSQPQLRRQPLHTP